MMPTSTNDVAPAFYAVSSGNQAAWPVATSCIFFLLSVLAVVAKLAARFKTTGARLYDALLIAATLLALAQTLCVLYACKHGLGKHRSDVDDASFEIFSKFFYAASILLVVSQAFCKLSMAHFLLVLSPYRSIVVLCCGTIAVTALWAVSGTVALATQCRLPKPWLSAPGTCINRQALHIYLGVVNIATDVALIAIPTYTMFKIQSAARFQVIALFSVRIVVPVFTIFSLLSLASLFSAHSDLTREAVMPTIWSQIMLNLSIITACIPSLKHVLDAFRSGAAAVSIASPYDVTVSKGGYLGWFGSMSQKREEKPRTATRREEVETGGSSGLTNGHHGSVIVESMDSKATELDDQSQAEVILPAENGQSKH